MAYTKTEWHNNSQPFIDEVNLNKIEEGIYQNSVDVEDLEQTISDLQAEIAQLKQDLRDQCIPIIIT